MTIITSARESQRIRRCAQLAGAAEVGGVFGRGHRCGRGRGRRGRAAAGAGAGAGAGSADADPGGAGREGRFRLHGAALRRAVWAGQVHRVPAGARRQRLRRDQGGWDLGGWTDQTAMTSDAMAVKQYLFSSRNEYSFERDEFSIIFIAHFL